MAGPPRGRRRGPGGARGSSGGSSSGSEADQEDEAHARRPRAPSRAQPAAVAAAARAAPSAAARPPAALAALEADLQRYASLLSRARAFMQQQRHFVRKRQDAILAAQAQWRSDHDTLDRRRAASAEGAAAAGGAGADEGAGAGGAPGAPVSAAQLRRVKGVLQQQVQELNGETRRLKTLKAQVGLRGCPSNTGTRLCIGRTPAPRVLAPVLCVLAESAGCAALRMRMRAQKRRSRNGKQAAPRHLAPLAHPWHRPRR